MPPERRSSRRSARQALVPPQGATQTTQTAQSRSSMRLRRAVSEDAEDLPLLLVTSVAAWRSRVLIYCYPEEGKETID